MSNKKPSTLKTSVSPDPVDHNSMEDSLPVGTIPGAQELILEDWYVLPANIGV